MTLAIRANTKIPLALAAALILMPTVAAQGFLDQIFGPFKGLDVAAAYARYSGIIDFIIYALLFTGIAHVTVGKRFEGRGGRAITIGVTMILTVSLLVVEKTMGFNIASFGPLAGGIVVLMVATTLYLVIRHLGGGHAASGSIAFIATYFSMRAVTPALFRWLAARAPFIHAVLAVAVLVAIWRAASELWPRSSRIVADTVAKGIKETKLAAREVFPTQEIRRERDLIRTKLQPFTKRDRQESKAVISNLKEMQAIVKEHQDSPYAVALITRKLAEVKPKQHDIEVRLASLQALTKRFLQLDESVIARVKGKNFARLSRTEQKLIRKIWQDEKGKINAEAGLQALEAEAGKLLASFDRSLNMAVANLKAGNSVECQKRLDEAIKTEALAGRLFKKMQKLEGQLRKWVELEAKTVRGA